MKKEYCNPHVSERMSFSYRDAVILLDKYRNAQYLSKGMNLVSFLGFNGDNYQLPMPFDALVTYDEFDGVKCSMHLWDSDNCEVWVYYLKDREGE